MAAVRHNLGGLKTILKGVQITGGAKVRINCNYLLACHGELVAVLVSDL
jgi:hypothetical protein